MNKDGRPPSDGVVVARETVAAMSRASFIAAATSHQSLASFNRSLGLKPRNRSVVAPRLQVEGLDRSTLWPHPFLNRLITEHFDLDLRRDDHAYFYGLALADGTIGSRPSRPNGSRSVAIEIRSSDGAVLLDIAAALPWKFNLTSRTRQSPFGGGSYASTCLSCHDMDLRLQMVSNGFPVGRKSAICAPPNVEYDAPAFWRGYLDGDGSVGMTAAGIPFVSLVTISPALKDAYCDFIAGVVGFRPSVNRNARDQAWNVMLVRDRAQLLLGAVYRGASLAVHRKLERAAEALAWKKAPDGHKARWDRYWAEKRLSQQMERQNAS